MEWLLVIAWTDCSKSLEYAGPSIERPFRVVRALTDGTIQRIYPDGKTETVQWKAGEVRARGPDKAYAVKNIGNSEFGVYVVQPK